MWSTLSLNGYGSNFITIKRALHCHIPFCSQILNAREDGPHRSHADCLLVQHLTGSLSLSLLSGMESMVCHFPLGSYGLFKSAQDLWSHTMFSFAGYLGVYRNTPWKKMSLACIGKYSNKLWIVAISIGFTPLRFPIDILRSCVILNRWHLCHAGSKRSRLPQLVVERRPGNTEQCTTTLLGREAMSVSQDFKFWSLHHSMWLWVML